MSGPPSPARRSPVAVAVAVGAGFAALATLGPLAPGRARADAPVGGVAYDHAHAASQHAIEAPSPPRIDGVLDDPIWRQAPRNTAFHSEVSKTYGQPSSNPTSVQVAYDARALYVAFECGYEEPRFPEDAPGLNAETDLYEYVGVYLDVRHDHSSALTFALTPSGYRADWEAWNDGAEANAEWTGLWQGRTRRHATGWTAEFAIPWGTLGLRDRGDAPVVGMNFRRYVRPGWVVWSLPPPGSPRPLPSYYGHLTGLAGLAPGQLLTLVPYVALGHRALPFYRRDADPGRLRDFDGGATPLSAYGGLYGRVEPGWGLRGDLVINPDFSQVNPDEARANLDRFELFFPEVRQFFVESNPNLTFGFDRYQLYYSRRLGLRRRLGGFDEVPLLYGATALYRRGGTSAAILDVLNERLDGPIELGVDSTVYRSHATVARLKHAFGGANRLGAIFLNQTQPWGGGAYRAFGADGAAALYKDHLVVSGFVAGSSKLEPELGMTGPLHGGDPSYERIDDVAWHAAAVWQSQDLEVSSSYLDVGRDFRAELGFFERTNVRRADLAAFYKPQIHNDFLRSLRIGPSVTRMVDRETDRTIVQKSSVTLEGTLLDRAVVGASFTQATDRVGSTFFVASRRLGIQPGEYTGLQTLLYVLSGPHQRLQAGLSYLDGYYFGGYQRILSPEIALKTGIFASRLAYQRYYLRPGRTTIAALPPDEDAVQGDRLSLRLVAAPSPELRLSAALELNTLDPTATTQLVGSWRFDGFSSLVVVASRSAPGADLWGSAPSQALLVKYSHGLVLP